MAPLTLVVGVTLASIEADAARVVGALPVRFPETGLHAGQVRQYAETLAAWTIRHPDAPLAVLVVSDVLLNALGHLVRERHLPAEAIAIIGRDMHGEPIRAHYGADRRPARRSGRGRSAAGRPPAGPRLGPSTQKAPCPTDG